MADNFGGPNTPKLVYSPFGDAARRGTYSMVGIDSTAPFEGSVISNTDAIGTSVQYGVRNFADDDLPYGIVKAFKKFGSSLPIKGNNFETVAGVVTNATAFAPMKYTFSATNDRSNANPSLELIEFLPILPGDVWEMSLVNDAGTATVNRGTTSGSDVEGGALAINTTATFGLTESTVSTTLANLDAQIITWNGKFPDRADRVFVQFIRLRTTVNVAD